MAGKLPDKPGWWWLAWSLPSDFGPGFVPGAVEVRADGPEGLSILVDRDYETNVREFVPVVEVRGRWLAPIPSPEVCAAVAELDAAVADADDMDLKAKGRAQQRAAETGEAVRAIRWGYAIECQKEVNRLCKALRAARKATP